MPARQRCSAVAGQAGEIGRGGKLVRENEVDGWAHSGGRRAGSTAIGGESHSGLQSETDSCELYYKLIKQLMRNKCLEILKITRTRYPDSVPFSPIYPEPELVNWTGQRH